MTIQTAHDDFFYKPYELTSTASAQNTDNALQDKYKHSQGIFSEVELDFNILDGIKEDLAYQCASQEVRTLIDNHRLKSAELLRFNAIASENSFEEDKYDKILGKPAETKTKQEESNADFLTRIQKFWSGFIVSLTATFLYYEHEILSNIGLLNIYRLSYVFSKNTWLYLWYYLRDLSILAKNSLINLKSLEFTTNIFYLLSVFLFVPRLIIDLGSIIKHALFPTTAEKVYTKTELAWIEFKRRYKRIGNDSVWIVINALTNFPQYFNIPVPVANWLLAGFFFFDVFFLSFILRQEMNKFDAKIKWIDEQLELIDNEESESVDNKQILLANKEQYKAMFELMKNQSNSMLAGTKATFGLYIAATLLFFVSFSLILTLGLQLALPIGFFVCVVAVGMILSGGSFGAAVQANSIKNIELEQGDANKLNANRIQNERDAWVDFGLKFAENIIMPMIIFGLVAVNWPTAIVVAVAYIAVKLYLSREKDCPKSDAKKEVSEIKIISASNDEDIDESFNPMHRKT